MSSLLVIESLLKQQGKKVVELAEFTTFADTSPPSPSLLDLVSVPQPLFRSRLNLRILHSPSWSGWRSVNLAESTRRHGPDSCSASPFSRAVFQLDS